MMSLGIWHKGSKNIRSIFVGWCLYLGVRVRVWPLKGTSVFTTGTVLWVSLFIFCYSDGAHRLILVYYISGTHYTPF